MADEHLAEMSPLFDAAYASEGRPGIPPERLIKALLLRALFSVRSERQLVEQINYNLLFRWFLDMRIDEPVFDATVFTHNRERLEKAGLIGVFFDHTVRRAKSAGLISTEHFSADGSLIEAYASIKSFKPRDRNSDDDESSGSNPFKSRNAEVDFHGHKRSNDTHESTTDPQAKLYRKGSGKEAKLCHALHTLIQNRNGIVLAVELNSPLGNSEPSTTLSLIDRVKRDLDLQPTTLGADKNYDQGGFLQGLEQRGIQPHVAMQKREEPATPAYVRKHQPQIQARRRLRGRLQDVGYKLSPRCRKKIEECFGWMKTIAGLHRTRHVGQRKTRQEATLAASAYNLLRLRALLG